MPSDGGHHTAEGSSRKRLKISRDASRPAGMSQTPDAISLVSPARREPAKVENDLHTDGTPCHHEQSLRNLNDNLDAMRQLITCKICQRFLYEPYALTCGHTFCYSCLSQWLGQNHKKTCPDCRTVIKEQPSPSYLVREMVLIFLGKSELLPDGETSEEHHQYAKEEADIVAKDKANTDVRTGGLFKGFFKRGGRLMPLVAIRDASDNVYRCPQCLNEVEDGRCNTCNVRVRGEDDDLDWSDEDSDESEELDHDLDDDDHFALPFDDMHDGYHGVMYDPDDFDEDLDDFDYGYELPPGLILRNGPVSDVSDEDSDDEGHDDEMDGFIDDGPTMYDASSEVNGDSDGTEVTNSRARRRRAAPIVLSDDDDDEEEEEDEGPAAAPRRRVVPVRTASSRASEEPSSAGPNPSVVSDDDSDDDQPVTASQRSRRGRRNHVHVIDESDEEDSDDQTNTTNRSGYGGFSPPQYDLTGETDEEGHEDEHEHHDYYDDRSTTSGPIEHSMEHYDDDEGDDQESDRSDDDGWGPNSRSASTHDQPLTCAADTPANNRGPSRESSHRLRTLGSRRNRHADPPSDSPPSYSSLFPTRATLAQCRRRLQTQPPPPRRPLLSEVATLIPNRANPAFQPVRPAPSHPFNLGNTLARISSNDFARIRNNPRRTPYDDYPDTYSRRNDSNVSSQSSVGGVSVRSGSGSGSSGSSRTIRADEENENGSRRRRRFAEI